MKPERTADTSVPMMWVSWIFHGVAPTNCPVFRSWRLSLEIVATPNTTPVTISARQTKPASVDAR